MRRAITAHRRDFTAIAALVLLAALVAAFILRHEPSFSFGQSFYTVSAEFQTAAAVTPGQGQSVNIAGVRVGRVGAVTLKGGHAVVQMNIEQKYAPIYGNATVLLRPRTPLKDMYLALDRGTKAAGAIPNGGSLGIANTLPDVNLDEILGSLDTDTRNYLVLLLSGGAGAFRDGGRVTGPPSPAAIGDLRGTFKRFAPLGRDTTAFATLLATRKANLSRAIHSLSLVAVSVGSVDSELAALIRSSNTNFAAISSQDASLQNALSLLPGTLALTSRTLVKVQAFAGQTGSTLQALQPFAHALAPALQASQPFLRETTPVIKNQLRPFSVAVQPLASVLRPAAANLAVAVPALVSSVKVFNVLFNTLAYQSGGQQQSYLFWGAWLSHIALTLTSLQDAHGPIVRGIFMSTCPQLDLLAGVQAGNPSLGALIDLLNPPDRTKICPGDQVP